MNNRKPWLKFFLDMTEEVGKQSTCMRRQVGAVAVKDKRILATGFNGAPAGIEHCEVRGCYRMENNIPSGQMPNSCFAVHSEQNVIIQAALHGISLKGADLFVNTFPCSICAKMIINAGFNSIVVGSNDYPDDFAKELFYESGIGVYTVKEDPVTGEVELVGFFQDEDTDSPLSEDEGNADLHPKTGRAYRSKKRIAEEKPSFPKGRLS